MTRRVVRSATQEQIDAMFDRRAEAYTRFDPVALTVDYADDCVVESPIGGTLFGRAAVEELFRSWRAAFPDVTGKQHEVLVAGDRLVYTVSLSGTDTGGFLGQDPTGKPFSVFAVCVCAMRGPQIVRERRVYDLSGLMLQLATDTKIAVEATRLYRATLERSRQEQELRIAARIQQALLPEGLYCGNNFDLAATSVPCRAIGGDFFDYLNLPSGSLGFALGDVAGKGPAAALLASKLQGILVANAHIVGATAAETIKRINDSLMHRAIEARFATLFYAVLSCDGRLTYCNAGHNPPLVFGTNGIRRLEQGGPVVGLLKDATFTEETLQLDLNDLLILFSDGVTEAFNESDEEFGEARLVSCVMAHHQLPPQALLERILDNVHDFAAAAPQTDDLTIMVMRHRPMPVAGAA